MYIIIIIIIIIIWIYMILKNYLKEYQLQIPNHVQLQFQEFEEFQIK
jgi:hypothetical protein